MATREPTIDAYPSATLPARLTVNATATAATGTGEAGWYYFEAAVGIINIVWSVSGATAATTSTGIQLDTAGVGPARYRYIYLRPGEKFTAIADGATKPLIWANTGER